MLGISPPPGSSVTAFDGGGSGPNSGGFGGKWHEGSSTPGPSRRGTGSSMDNTGMASPPGATGTGTQSGRQANFQLNAEAGPSKISTNRQRVTSGPPPNTAPTSNFPSSSTASPLPSNWSTPYHQRQRSASHSPTISNEILKGARPSISHHSHPQIPQQQGHRKGLLTENIASTPPSSSPPSPSSPSFSGAIHQRQHSRSASADYVQVPPPLIPPSQHPHPRSSTLPVNTSPLALYSPNQASDPAPILSRSQPSQPQPYDPLTVGPLISSPPLGSGCSDVDELMVIPSSEEEISEIGGGWKLVSRGYQVTPGGSHHTHASGGGFMVLGKKEKGTTLKMMRRRTAVDPSGTPFQIRAGL